MKTVAIRLEAKDAESIRAIAAAFEFYVERGLGAGEIGNATAVCHRIAVAYRHNPAATLARLGPLLAGGEVSE